jgi:rhodanese-related sulfurtransferase
MQDMMVLIRKAVIQAALIVMLGMVLAVVVHALRPDGLPFFSSGPERKTTQIGQSGLKMLSASESWSLYHQGRAVFLDARDKYAYESAHLPGAIHVPPEVVNVNIHELRDLARDSKVLIAYCESRGCGKAVELAASLQAYGIRGVSVFPDGWQGWVDSGYPIEEGKH